MFYGKRRLLVIGLAVLVWQAGVGAEDWPTYLHDNARSGVTSEALSLPLCEKWVHRSALAPSPAWPPPAKNDYWHHHRGLRPLITFDRAYHAVVAGDAVYFGASADDHVYCLDAATGEERWRFCTEGPLRLAPTVADGKVYVGSDDGWAYCLDAADGALVWKHRGADLDHRLPGNGRMMSMWPVRTSVLVDDGTAYYCAGLFPAYGVYRYALDAGSGDVVWREATDNVAPQGYLLASAQRLYMPNSRSAPHMFERATGKYLGGLEAQGGAYAILVEDTLVSGPGRTSGQLDLSDTATKESIVAFDGLRMIVHEGMAYLQSKKRISAFDRVRHGELARERHALDKRRKELEDKLKPYRSNPDAPEAAPMREEFARVEQSMAKLTEAMRDCFTWQEFRPYPFAMILAGDVLFAGGDGQVVAINAAYGAELWSGEVQGKAYGLAVANGALYVSTDAGRIHCFTPELVERAYVTGDTATPIAAPPDGLSDVYADAAQRIVEAAWTADTPPDMRKGYCLVLDSGEGRLATELAKQTQMRIVAVEDDPALVAASREELRRLDLYGSRVVVHHIAGDSLPYTSYCANLVVSDGALMGCMPATSAAEVHRVLRPLGGLALIGQAEQARKQCEKLSRNDVAGWFADDDAWQVSKQDGLWASLQRGEVPGSGEWTQLYADTGHTADSGDQVRAPLTLQWFGEPGPREIIDRHHRPMASLVKNGRVFVPANDRVIAADAYNGTPLWELSVPNSRRVGAMKNCGHMLVTDKHLYVAVEDECRAVDVITGVPEFALKAPQLTNGPSDWGYLNRVDDLLLGSGQKRHASFVRFDKEMVNLLEGDFRPVIVSDYMFCVDRFSGEVQWTYQGGAVMNSATTVAGDTLCFIESRNREAVGNTDGRLRINAFCASDTYLVGLDVATGEKVYEHAITLPYEHIMFLNTSEGTLLATGTYNREDRVYYGLYAFDADTGEPKWQTEYLALDVRANDPAGTGGSHGEQWQHPVLNGDTIYSRPYAFSLDTGEQLEYKVFRGGHGCGGLTGSSFYLYGRGSNPRMYPTEVPTTDGIPLTYTTRPGCWLNIIPAGGLVLIPESSAGCTCDYALQTSLAFIPKALSGLPGEG